VFAVASDQRTDILRHIEPVRHQSGDQSTSGHSATVGWDPREISGLAEVLTAQGECNIALFTRASPSVGMSLGQSRPTPRCCLFLFLE
jgi:hypothetical protein